MGQVSRLWCSAAVVNEPVVLGVGSSGVGAAPWFVVPLLVPESDGVGAGLDAGSVDGDSVGEGDCDGDCDGLDESVGDAEDEDGDGDGDVDDTDGDGDREGLAVAVAVGDVQPVGEAPGKTGSDVGSPVGPGLAGA